MKTLRATGLVMIVAAATLFGAAVAGADTTATQTINFGSYPAGTSVTAIHEPGVTFSFTSGGAARTDGRVLRLNEPGSFVSTTLVMDLARPASAISFLYQTFGNCGRPINQIQLFLHGVQVDSLTVDSCVTDTYARTLSFDQLRVTAGLVANSEEVLIPAITLTYPVTKDDCKGAGWKDLGYANQGQCVKATSH